jgi:Na+-driven multidrug efflux pump
MFLPAVAIGFATAPVAGQNFGAREGARVRQTFQAAAVMSILIMLTLTVVCQLKARAMVAVFNSDAAVVAFGAEYLGIISWNFVASGLIFVISSTFQGMGNTVPALASSVLRLVVFAVPAYLLSHRVGFQMRHVWYAALGAVFVHLCVSGLLLRREFGKRLSFV